MMFLVIPAAFLVAISILVAVHEFGHYWVAKKLGFKVLRFSIGFGKPLLTRVGKDADHTEYCIAAIPLGGYVRLLDEREGDVAESELHRSFTRRPISHRSAVGGTCDESLICIPAVRDFGDGRNRNRQAGGRSGAARQPGCPRRTAARRSNRSCRGTQCQRHRRAADCADSSIQRRWFDPAAGAARRNRTTRDITRERGSACHDGTG